MATRVNRRLTRLLRPVRGPAPACSRVDGGSELGGRRAGRLRRKTLHLPLSAWGAQSGSTLRNRLDSVGLASWLGHGMALAYTLRRRQGLPISDYKESDRYA